MLQKPSGNFTTQSAQICKKQQQYSVLRLFEGFRMESTIMNKVLLQGLFCSLADREQMSVSGGWLTGTVYTLIVDTLEACFLQHNNEKVPQNNDLLSHDEEINSHYYDITYGYVTSFF